jgi:predicted RNase H-like HicB family nuclease
MNPRYSMAMQWSEEDQVFVVSLPEFGPYCQTHGASYEEAVRKGQETIDSLIEAYMADHRSLPAPVLWKEEQALAS